MHKELSADLIVVGGSTGSRNFKYTENKNIVIGQYSLSTTDKDLV